MTIYILDPKGIPTPTADAHAWVKFMDQDHALASTRHGRDTTIITRFLGLDARPEGGEPLLYETRVKGGLLSGLSDRYGDKASALAGHERLAAFVEKRAA